MNLPHPFNKASDVRADAQGTINLIDYMGKALARIPLTTAFELSTGSKGLGSGDGYGFTDGAGSGSSYGSNSGYGIGEGYGRTYGDGSGRGEGK
jgi:hypothetical protein